MRATRLTYDDKNEVLFAATNRGTLQKLTRDLDLIGESSPQYNLFGTYALCDIGDYIIGRELTGKLLRWRKQDLFLDRVVDLNRWAPAEIAEFPNVSHNLFVKDNLLFVSMPNGPIGKFSLPDLEFIGLIPFQPKALVECIDASGPQAHVLVDFSGALYKGNLETGFEFVTQIANGATHEIAYDHHHDRYWITDDIHCGLALFELSNPSNLKRFDLTHDDVEGMSFNSDQSQVLVACFDRFVYRIQNDETPAIVARIGPLRYQITQVIWANSKVAFALTEAGDIYQLNLQDDTIAAHSMGSNAVWDIRYAGDNTYLAAFEDGFVRKIVASSHALAVVDESQLGLGHIRRIWPDNNGGAFVLSTLGTVARLDDKLRIIWQHTTKPLLRDFAVGNGYLILVSEQGEILKINSETGQQEWKSIVDRPLFSVTINPSGEFFVASERLSGRANTEKIQARLLIGKTSDGSFVREHTYQGSIKRMQWTCHNQLLINGNGEIATSLLAWPTLDLQMKWSEWQLNTCEAVCELDDKIYTSTYGYQLNKYSRTGEILESTFPFEDYAFALVPESQNGLLAGGRGAFITLFRSRGDQLVSTYTLRFT